MNKRHDNLIWFSIAVALLSLAGCGPSAAVELPNGYAVVVTSSDDSAIVHEASGRIVVESYVWVLDTHGRHVFGKVADPRTKRHAYFTLDTVTGDVRTYAVKYDWEAAVAAFGATEINLRGPSVLFHLQETAWWPAIIYGVPALFISIPALVTAWYFRRAQKDRLEAREEHAHW